VIEDKRQEALAMTKGMPASPSNIDRAARRFGIETVRWAFTQWELRTRAKAKFSAADDMLFLREALEQASSEKVAEFHASLFPEGVLVADLTAGIGGDLVALARRGPTIGFELDAERLETARHNLEVCGVGAELRQQDSLEGTWTWGYAFADPARRAQGRRTLDPSEFSPNPGLLAARFADLRLGVMKLSPLLPDSFLSTLGPSLRFVSCEGECREAVIAAGQEATSERLAVHIESGETLAAGVDAVCTDDAAEFFFDADSAAVRAHCLGSLASRHNLLALGDSRGYLTGGVQFASPWLRPYRVLYSGRADLSRTKEQLKQLGAGTPEIKQRHADQSPEQIRKALNCDGDRRVSLAVWPVGRSLRHTILEQL
jgi:hypothetical protein